MADMEGEEVHIYIEVLKEEGGNSRSEYSQEYLFNIWNLREGGRRGRERGGRREGQRQGRAPLKFYI